MYWCAHKTATLTSIQHTVKGGQNLPLLVGIRLTDLPNIEGEGPVPPAAPFPAYLVYTRELTFSFIRDYCSIVYGTIHLGRPQVGGGGVKFH